MVFHIYVNIAEKGLVGLHGFTWVYMGLPHSLGRTNSLATLAIPPHLTSPGIQLVRVLVVGLATASFTKSIFKAAMKCCKN